MTFPSSNQLLLNGRPFLRCVRFSTAELEWLKDEAIGKSYLFTEVDLVTTHTRESLMKKMSNALNFPNYFGGNWDSLLDMITDLSWNPASGYVLLLKDAEALLELSSEEFTTFVHLCSAAVERWQVGESEVGETSPQIPLYLFLEGETSFCRLIADLLGSH